MINKKNFVPTVCVVFTIVLFGKLILEAFFHYKDQFYFQNIVSILVFSIGGTFVLTLQNFLKEIPLLFVILLQYGLLVGFVMLFVFIGSFFDPVSESGYLDMFLSVTIPYAIGATIYYIAYFKQVKQANQTIHEIRDTRSIEIK